MYVVCVRDCDLRQLGPAAYICRYRYVSSYICVPGDENGEWPLRKTAAYTQSDKSEAVHSCKKRKEKKRTKEKRSRDLELGSIYLYMIDTRNAPPC